MGTEARNPDDRRAGRGAADAPRIAYSPRADATPEDEARALAGVYAFLIENAERRETIEIERGVGGAEREDA